MTSHTLGLFEKSTPALFDVTNNVQNIHCSEIDDGEPKSEVTESDLGPISEKPKNC